MRLSFGSTKESFTIVIYISHKAKLVSWLEQPGMQYIGHEIPVTRTSVNMSQTTIDEKPASCSCIW